MRCALAVAGCLIPTGAHADHHDMAMTQDAPGSSFDASVAVLAASFSTTYYGGNYEGVVPAVGWANDRLGVGASWAYYRLLENGFERFGEGDLVMHGQATLAGARDLQGGVQAAVSVPTGNDELGFGMGHVMLMPAAWGAWRHDWLALTASFGYSRAVVHATSLHDHGMWPLVEPMNMSELTWSGGGEATLAEGVRAGARLSGGVPVGVLPGHERMVGSLRVAWATGGVDTTAELQAGLVGDPFNIRGVIATSLRF
jgi:hypothetical protein